jgi:hypothetical protein
MKPKYFLLDEPSHDISAAGMLNCLSKRAARHKGPLITVTRHCLGKHPQKMNETRNRL